MPGGTQRGVDHRRHRSLAVCAGNVHRLECALGDIELRENRRDVLEAEFDAELREREEVFERAGGHTWGAGSATAIGWGGSAAAGSGDTAPINRRALAMTAFISRRSTTRSSIPFSSRNSLR